MTFVVCYEYILFCFPELPDDGPVISGGLQNYQLNDQLTLNCTSPRTFPPTLLKWKINKKAVNFLLFPILCIVKLQAVDWYTIQL